MTGELSREVNGDNATQRFESYDWQRALSASVAAHAARTVVRRNEQQHRVANGSHLLPEPQVTAAPPVGQTGTRTTPTVAVTATDPTVGHCPTDQLGSQQ